MTYSVISTTYLHITMHIRTTKLNITLLQPIKLYYYIKFYYHMKTTKSNITILQPIHLYYYITHYKQCITLNSRSLLQTFPSLMPFSRFNKLILLGNFYHYYCVPLLFLLFISLLF